MRHRDVLFELFRSSKKVNNDYSVSVSVKKIVILTTNYVTFNLIVILCEIHMGVKLYSTNIESKDNVEGLWNT